MIGVRAATAQPAGCSDSTSVEGSARSGFTLGVLD
jgi:hypothetical protein